MKYLFFSFLFVFTYNQAQADVYNCFYTNNQTKETFHMSVEIEIETQTIVSVREDFQFMNALEIAEGNIDLFTEQTTEEPVLWGLFSIKKTQKMLLRFGSDLIADLPTVRMRRILFDDNGRVVDSRPYQCGKATDL